MKSILSLQWALGPGRDPLEQCQKRQGAAAGEGRGLGALGAPYCCTYQGPHSRGEVEVLGKGDPLVVRLYLWWGAPSPPSQLVLKAQAKAG